MAFQSLKPCELVTLYNPRNFNATYCTRRRRAVGSLSNRGRRRWRRRRQPLMIQIQVSMRLISIGRICMRDDEPRLLR